jgi:hypothetical protein
MPRLPPRAPAEGCTAPLLSLAAPAADAATAARDAAATPHRLQHDATELNLDGAAFVRHRPDALSGVRR